MRKTSIYGGSNEIQKNIISKNNNEIFFGSLSKIIHDYVRDDPTPNRKLIKDLQANFYTFLKNRKVFAAIDVFPTEPFPKNDKFRKLKNVIFSPHRAGALETAFKEMGSIVLSDLKLIDRI